MITILCLCLQQETLTSGLATASMLDEDPPALRVTWIRWDSGFRGTDLRIGDRILEVNGRPIARVATARERQKLLSTSIGQYAESQAWAGLKSGAAVTLRVRRAAEPEGSRVLEVRGRLTAVRTLTNRQGRALIAAEGPMEGEYDGFPQPWRRWYDAQIALGERVLDGGWWRGIDNRALLKQHLAEETRVEFLAKKYPGPFADAVRDDWNRVRDALLGRKYELRAEDLAYRELGEKRAAAIAEFAAPARKEFLARLETIEPFPVLNPLQGDLKTVAGRIVVLPEISLRDALMDSGRAYRFCGDRSKGWYFIDTTSPEMRRIGEALYRYRRAVTPKIPETYAFIGRIRPEPRMMVIQGKAARGLELDVLAVTVGNRVFLDASGSFAGEETLRALPSERLPDDASPRTVMESFVAALKEGNEPAWTPLYARWRAESWRDDFVFYPFHAPAASSWWIESRRLILDRVYDLRVVHVSDPRRIFTGREFEGAPVVDEVWVELEHVGKFGDEYRSFVSIGVNRRWRLIRRDGGPWRIASAHGI